MGFEGTFGDSNAVLLHLSAAGKILSDTADTGTGSSAIACQTASLCFMSDYASPTESLQVVKKGSSVPRTRSRRTPPSRA